MIIVVDGKQCRNTGVESLSLLARSREGKYGLEGGKERGRANFIRPTRY